PYGIFLYAMARDGVVSPAHQHRSQKSARSSADVSPPTRDASSNEGEMRSLPPRAWLLWPRALSSLAHGGRNVSSASPDPHRRARLRRFGRFVLRVRQETLGRELRRSALHSIAHARGG